jgi:hypothetical protein
MPFRNRAVAAKDRIEEIVAPTKRIVILYVFDS